MKRLALGMCTLAVLPASCVATHDAVLSSCCYEPQAMEQAPTPEFYRVGEHYYLKTTVRYICEANGVCVGGMPVVGGEVELPMSYSDEKAPETLYVLMAPDAVKCCLGQNVTTVARDAPRVVEEDDWDAAEAEWCEPLRTCPTKVAYYAEKESSYRMCTRQADHLLVGLPYTYSWDAVYKYPLAAALFVGVDVPASSLMLGAMLITDLTVGSYKTMFCQQQPAMPLPEDMMPPPQQTQDKEAD